MNKTMTLEHVIFEFHGQNSFPFSLIRGNVKLLRGAFDWEISI